MIKRLINVSCAVQYADNIYTAWDYPVEDEVVSKAGHRPLADASQSRINARTRSAYSWGVKKRLKSLMGCVEKTKRRLDIRFFGEVNHKSINVALGLRRDPDAVS